jgi:hypothetical protein
LKGGRYSDVVVNTGLAVIILLIFGNSEQVCLQINKQTKKQTNRYKTIAKITKLRKNIISLLIFGNSEQTCFQVIHNYGHGGSGVTLFWGCAEDVVKIIQQQKAQKTDE